ncbi:uncharacterized protein [Atheta coriaria]|uniref:uncharacterized protein n=1 Tax=Dalotia coriaria TaxID=877792 RepID=UPI0031F45BCC
MEFTKSERGKPILIYAGFEYLQFRVKENIIVWRCRQSRSAKCHAQMKTSNNEIIEEPTTHCHDSCPQKIEAQKALIRMKEVMTDIGATPRDAIGALMATVHNDVLTHLPKQSSLQRNLCRHRQAGQLPNPTTSAFDMPAKYAPLILHDTGRDDPERILVLGDSALLMQLNQEEIYGDGTFDKDPKIFYQLFTWHAKVGNSYPPCIYFLLQKKNANTYRKMFDILQELLPDLAPVKIFIDFEQALMNCAGDAFPNAEIKGSYFHLTQSLVRQIGNVGLKQQYDTDIHIRNQLKSLAALAFVPIKDVQDVYNQLAVTMPDDESYREVLGYFRATYVGAPHKNPQFPVRIWNHYQAALERSPITTGEGFHNALNSLFHCSHPSVWRLFDGLLRDIGCNKLTLVNALTGQIEVKKKKSENLYIAVSTAAQNYNNADDKVQYLRSLANLQ